jgi:hypothetical protein
VLALGSGNPNSFSTLIAELFTSIRYPILRESASLNGNAIMDADDPFRGSKLHLDRPTSDRAYFNRLPQVAAT